MIEILEYARIVLVVLVVVLCALVVVGTFVDAIVKGKVVEAIGGAAIFFLVLIIVIFVISCFIAYYEFKQPPECKPLPAERIENESNKKGD